MSDVLLLENKTYTHFQRPIIIETQVERNYRIAHTPRSTFASFLHEKPIKVGIFVFFVNDQGKEFIAHEYQRKAAIDFHNRLGNGEEFFEKGIRLSRSYRIKDFIFTLYANPPNPNIIELQRYIDGDESGVVKIKQVDYIMKRENGTTGIIRVKESYMRKIEPKYELKANLQE